MKQGDGLPDGITQLRALGQSVWLDDLGRHLLDTGTLARLVAEGITGVTSNPAIFAEAVRAAAYDEPIGRLAGSGLAASAIAERLVLDDVARAAEILRPVQNATGGRDGFVSIEVGPALADDLDGTIAEAHRLWQALDRPNVMIKVPGTATGVEATRRLIADGINVNVTLLFAPQRHMDVLQAHLAGIEARIASGATDLPASVASFFLSRIDVAVDQRIDARGGAWSHRIRGLVATAAARLAWQSALDFTSSERWRRAAAAGARPQRLLWASTGVKDAAYPQTKYVEGLALEGTVTTLTRTTLAATLAMGRPRDPDPATFEALSGKLAELDIDTATIFRDLESDGVRKFLAAQQAMEATIADRLRDHERPSG